jgi:hypothetical protein
VFSETFENIVMNLNEQKKILDEIPKVPAKRCSV